MSSVSDLVAHHLGGKEDKPAKEIREVRVRKGKSGGHIIEHHHTHPEHHPMEEHATKGDDEMVNHMMQNMGTPNPGEAAADAGTPDAMGASAGAPAAPSPAGSGSPMPVGA